MPNAVISDVCVGHAPERAAPSRHLHNDFVASESTLAEDSVSLINLNEDDFSFTLPYHVMRHYARHTDVEWVRVGATTSAPDEQDLLVSAWLSPDEDARTVLLINAGVTEIDVELDGGEESPTDSEVTRTVFEGIERSAELGPLPVEGVVRVPGRAIVTVALRR
jgi:hypothetical protein